MNAIKCDLCDRSFAEMIDLWQHRKSKHKLKAKNNPKPFSGRDDDDFSYAERATEAQIKSEAGLPLKPWEEGFVIK